MTVKHKNAFLLTCYFINYRMSLWLHVSVIVWPSLGQQELSCTCFYCASMFSVKHNGIPLCFLHCAYLVIISCNGMEGTKKKNDNMWWHRETAWSYLRQWANSMITSWENGQATWLYVESLVNSMIISEDTGKHHETLDN